MANEEDIRASAERLLRRVSMVSKARSIGDGIDLEASIRALRVAHSSMRDVAGGGEKSVSTLGTLGEDTEHPVESDGSDEEEAAGAAVLVVDEEAAPVRRPAARRSSFAAPIDEEDPQHAGALGVLHSGAVQNFLLTLLVLDVLMLFAQLAIESYFPTCERVVQNAISCCPDGGHDGTDAHHPDEAVLRILTGEGDHAHGHGLCAAPLAETGHEAGCDPSQHAGARLAHDVLFWATIGILNAFLIEILASARLLGGAFFRRCARVGDLLLVVATLSLELAFRFLDVAPPALPGMLVLFRVWRFARIGRGSTASTREVRLAARHLDELEGRMRRRGVEVPERPEALRKGGG